jgi:hypothetical protein
MAYYPEIPYKGNQVIICSDRLHFQSRTDSILLFGKQSVAISSINSVNLDASSKIIIQSPAVHLGSVEAKSPLVLGDVYVNTLTLFLDKISTACVQLQSVSAGATPPNPELGSAMLKLATFGKQLASFCSELKQSLPNSLSKTCNTV